MPASYRPARIAALVGGLLLLAVGVLAPAAPAWAHNELTASAPADGARLAAPPRQVVLTFAQRLDQRYTQIVVTDGHREPMPARQPTVSGTSATLDLEGDLPDGGYTVAYRVVSPDGHPVQGALTFSVGPATAAASPGAPIAAPPPAETESRRPTSAILGAGAAAALAIAGGWAVRHRRARAR
ncbi:copper resistance protein CopC [Asanoa sp. WMMD1127]|uniref:copper resistance CopC family protein n=1 Tax=Asanoa sp. WMMD1127 TaxID=3016107 RepID=UPI002417E223|nr:copper resistance CopC family protein [Asanoa sp. WMMD1127]MDG4827460.1 copper resistance protein CopC [Asanoa sp. WMMD1127]